MKRISSPQALVPAVPKYPCQVPRDFAQKEAFFLDAFLYLEHEIAQLKKLVVESEDALQRYRAIWDKLQSERQWPGK